MSEQEMSEQEKMDSLLRGMMASAAAPSLSLGFDQRLKKRLRPRRLSSAGRMIMGLYAVLTLVVSVWAMRSQSIAWSLIAIAIIAPLFLVVATQYRLTRVGADLD